MRMARMLLRECRWMYFNWRLAIPVQLSYDYLPHLSADLVPDTPFDNEDLLRVSWPAERFDD